MPHISDLSADSQTNFTRRLFGGIGCVNGIGSENSSRLGSGMQEGCLLKIFYWEKRLLTKDKNWGIVGSGNYRILRESLRRGCGCFIFNIQ
jgi:hypothetical protein